LSTLDTERGAASYTPTFLKYVYDPLVLWYTNRSVWQCSTPRQLEFFREHAGTDHLDIGVATGYFPAHAGWQPGTHTVSLMDLSPSALEFAAKRIAKLNPTTYLADVTKPLELPEGTRFDSVSMLAVLHCVPGAMRDKAAAAAGNVAPFLADDGILFGTTVLGSGAAHKPAGRKLLARYNAQGIFANIDDTAADLEAGLRTAFAAVEVTTEGAVAMFTAREPIRGSD